MLVLVLERLNEVFVGSVNLSNRVVPHSTGCDTKSAQVCSFVCVLYEDY